VIWRVRGRAEFAALSRTRRQARGPLSVRVICDAAGTPPRVAYAIGRNIGPAVVRNRVRRRLRAAAAQSSDLLREGCAYLVGVGPGADSLTFGELRTTLRACLTASSAQAAVAS
jgi:ribonuclease P protein component